MAPKLTIGMATFDDFDGVYFSLQALRLYHDLTDVELVVVDNGTKVQRTSDMVKDILGQFRGAMGPEYVQYVPYTERSGTTGGRDHLFKVARGRRVACMDSHVLLVPGAVDRLKQLDDTEEFANDIITGPILWADLRSGATHVNDQWRGNMHGTWGGTWVCQCGQTKFSPLQEEGKGTSYVSLTMNPVPITRCSGCLMKLPEQPVEHGRHVGELMRAGFRMYGLNPNDKPFEIPGHGLGFFSMRKDKWPGFHDQFVGFGGEELYIHEKVRQQLGGRAICDPKLGWNHRFGRPYGVQYPVMTEDRVHNYILGHNELGWELDRLHEHFIARGQLSEAVWEFMVANPGQLPPKDLIPKYTTGGRLPQPGPRVSTPMALFNWGKGMKRDLEMHFDMMKEFADRCDRVTEFTGRRESTIPWIASNAKIVRSYQTETDLLVDCYKTDRFNAFKDVKVIHNDSPEVPEIEETDLLFLDTVHTEARVFDELTRFHSKVTSYIMLHDTTIYGQRGEDGGPGLLSAIVKFTMANPEWTLYRAESRQHGMVVLTRREEDKKPLPGLFEKAANWSKSTAVHLATGAQATPPKLFAKRTTICGACTLRNGDACGQCGCPIAKKAARLSSECPLKLWDLENPFPHLGEAFEELLNAGVAPVAMPIIEKPVEEKPADRPAQGFASLKDAFSRKD